MVTLNVVNAENKIKGTIAGDHYDVPFSDENKATLEGIEQDIKAKYPLQTREDKEEVLAMVENFRKAVKVMKEEGAQPLTSKEFPEFLVDGKGNYYLTHNGVTSELVIPKPFIEDIRTSKEKGIDYSPIIKFIVRLFRNPNVRDGRDRERAQEFLNEVAAYVTQTFVSKPLVKKFMEEDGYENEKARELAIVRQTPYTAEGLLNVKKVVNPIMHKWELDENGDAIRKPLYGATKVDPVSGKVLETNEPVFNEDWIFEPVVKGQTGDAFHCGTRGLGHIIAVGEETRLESWEQVDTNPNHSCVKGLHFGNQDYLNGWEREGNVTLNYFLDPAFIGAIPYRDVAGVLRAQRAFPHSVKNRETDNRNLYHSSTYAAELDTVWADMKVEAVNTYKMEVEKLERLIKEAQDFC